MFIDEILIASLLAEVGIIEKLAVGGESLVVVMQMEQEQLLQGGVAVRTPVRFACQVVLRLHFTAVDGEGRKFFGETEQGGIHIPRLCREPAA